ncbi:MAG TPA: S-adenosylmethionine:tRNA ribosyltransferase-isomerase [Flavobacteriales bacterium]|jgi:S-adenosylmethionine:tRNA ribosyltransferase-isomerase|nr:S-adenosylmethionine:tRNA ribosyltransferase-isomerase [Flavobacteriales bacterium]
MDPRSIAIADLTYDLPTERIAQRPLEERDATKLLVWKEGAIHDRTFRALPDELPPGTLLVLNDTRVVHARMAFHRQSGARIECIVLSPAGDRAIELALLDQGTSQWWCMVGNAKRWKGEELVAEREGHTLRMERSAVRDGEHLITFRWEGSEPFVRQLGRFGEVPLPPYMRRAADADDDIRYNTVFGVRPGSVAAPTASLHFTHALMDALQQRGVHTAHVTLHVGAGTFLPVKSATMNGHAMHAEQVRIARGTIEAVLQQKGKGPIVPVGTTALRTIESLYWFGADLLAGKEALFLDVDQWRPYAEDPAPTMEAALEAVLAWMDRHDGLEMLMGSTRLLIAPGYRFRVADGLITNFHQPQSTLLLIVAALAGPNWRRIYDHALANGYRFLSYGDGSLLWWTPLP